MKEITKTMKELNCNSRDYTEGGGATQKVVSCPEITTPPDPTRPGTIHMMLRIIKQKPTTTPQVPQQ